MAVYTPNIPLGTDNISASQPQIKDNFNVLNTAFAVDHTAFSLAPNAGQHKQVTIIGPGPGVAPGLSSVFHSLAATGILNLGKPLAAFANSVDDYNLMPDLQYTNVAIPPFAETYSFYLGDLLINCGYVTSFAQVTKVDFQTPYTALNQIVCVQGTKVGVNPVIYTVAYTITDITFALNGGAFPGEIFHYFVIGY